MTSPRMKQCLELCERSYQRLDKAREDIKNNNFDDAERGIDNVLHAVDSFKNEIYFSSSRLEKYSPILDVIIDEADKLDLEFCDKYIKSIEGKYKK